MFYIIIIYYLYPIKNIKKATTLWLHVSINQCVIVNAVAMLMALSGRMCLANLVQVMSVAQQKMT